MDTRGERGCQAEEGDLQVMAGPFELQSQQTANGKPSDQRLGLSLREEGEMGGRSLEQERRVGHWTSSIPLREYWSGHGSLPNQSTCVLWIWGRLMTVGDRLQEYGVDGLLLRAIRSLYCWSQSMVGIAGSKSDPFPLRLGLCQGYPLPPVLVIIFRISRHSQAVEGGKFGYLQIPSLLFVDVIVVLASSNCDLQLSLGLFAVECEAAGMRISNSKTETMVLSQKRVDCPLQVRGELLP